MSEMSEALRPFQAADNEYKNLVFEHIRVEHYLPAIREALRIARESLGEIKSNRERPDFRNTVEALETSGEDLNLTAGTYFNLFNAHGSPEHHALAGEISSLIAEYESDLSLDEELFERVRTVYDTRGEQDLSPEQSRLTETVYRGFTRNGALLNEADKARLREIDRELATLGPRFSQNELAATNAFELLLKDEAELEGLPVTVREAAAHAARRKGYEQGWLITLQAPSIKPFLTYSARRELREKVLRAQNAKAYGGEYDNQGILKRIVRLRHERARLLGHAGHAEYVLVERMAETPAAVTSFLDRLLEASRPSAEREVRDLRELAREVDGLEDFQGWDASYYTELLKQRRLKLDEEELRRYFKLENVLEGLFEVAARLYGLSFRRLEGFSVYHEEVAAYDVRLGDRHMGLLYLDLFPRETKQSGAWAASFLSQGLYRGELRRPHVSMVCNFTPSTPERPSLLRYEEVRTLFHEFGHALHALLSECRYQALSGPHVYWDFVELPSQIMENWILDQETLNLFARHYETGETIPPELVTRMRSLRSFMAGYNTLRQLRFGFLDMAWHLEDPGEVEDTEAFEREKLDRTLLFPEIPGSLISSSFSHIFAGGYSSGYYSYKWAEVLDADAFELFKERGIFNREVAESFRVQVLSRGNSAHPMELYLAFRGRKPDPEALLRRCGLL